MTIMKNALIFFLTKETGEEFLQLTIIAEKCTVLIRFMSIHSEKTVHI